MHFLHLVQCKMQLFFILFAKIKTMKQFMDIKQMFSGLTCKQQHILPSLEHLLNQILTASHCRLQQALKRAKSFSVVNVIILRGIFKHLQTAFTNDESINKITENT